MGQDENQLPQKDVKETENGERKKLKKSGNWKIIDKFATQRK